METKTISDEDRQEMQALIGSGFGTMRFSEYVLLDITSAPKARAWLNQALSCVWTVGKLGSQKARGLLFKDEGEEAWSIAFTHRGLVCLGIAEDPEAPFPSEFRSGQADENRRKLSCEDPTVCWQWGDVAVPTRKPSPQPVSILVVRTHDGVSPRGNPLLDTGKLAACGLQLVRRVHGSPDSLKTTLSRGKEVTYLEEPFGFRDGMGQPKVQGLQGFRSGGAALEDKASVPLGEFVLGHPNAYGEESHCPEVKRCVAVPPEHSFGRNGSYLAVQQILQDVGEFRRFDAANPPAGNEPSVVEKMIGRRKDGRPLQVVPNTLEPDDPFGFHTNDPHGFQCPIGAHVRRANPRDSVLDAGEQRPAPGNLHRLLRRSRPFVSTGAADDRVPPAQPAAEVGIFFIAVVADLSRQFEFVKRGWIGNARFGNLSGEVDPLLGRASGRHFTMPGQPTGSRVHALPDLTRTQGGGYFFMPALGTLKRIAAGDYTTASEEGAP